MSFQLYLKAFRIGSEKVRSEAQNQENILENIHFYWKIIRFNVYIWDVIALKYFFYFQFDMLSDELGAMRWFGRNNEW